MTASRAILICAGISMGCFTTASTAVAQPVLTVNAAGPGAGAWADAFTDLQDALVFAAESGGAVTEIWVAAGTYTPDPITLDRAAAFNMLSGVALYGGFAGVETAREQRDPDAHVTVLSGDLLGNDFSGGDNTDNSYHVVNASNADASAVLDGFTITGGNAYGGALSQRSGGGIYMADASPTINRCVFDGNVTSPTGGTLGGGAVYALRSSPTFVDCRFTMNFAGAGGAMMNVESNAVCHRCVFVANDSFQGGAVRNVRSDLTLINSVLADNAVTAYGGAIYNTDGYVVLINSTVANNQAPNVGGGLYTAGTGGLTVANSILWNNADSGVDESSQILVVGGVADVSYSCVQGWTGALGGAGNIGNDPLFVGGDEVPARFKLSAGSPCIDAGDNSALPVDVTMDLEGWSRYADDVGVVDSGNGVAPIVDMGAFEFQETTGGQDPGEEPTEPQTPVEMLRGMLDVLAAMDIPPALERQLKERIDSVIEKLEDGNPRNDKAAANKLGALVNAVSAQKGKKVPASDADTLIDAASAVIAALNGA